MPIDMYILTWLYLLMWTHVQFPNAARWCAHFSSVTRNEPCRVCMCSNRFTGFFIAWNRRFRSIHLKCMPCFILFSLDIHIIWMECQKLPKKKQTKWGSMKLCKTTFKTDNCLSLLAELHLYWASTKKICIRNFCTRHIGKMYIDGLRAILALRVLVKWH